MTDRAPSTFRNLPQKLENFDGFIKKWSLKTHLEVTRRIKDLDWTVDDIAHQIILECVCFSDGKAQFQSIDEVQDQFPGSDFDPVFDQILNLCGFVKRKPTGASELEALKELDAAGKNLSETGTGGSSPKLPSEPAALKRK